MQTTIAYDVFHLIYWDWRIALDLFLGGLGVGAFIYAIAIMVYKKDDKLLSVKLGSVIGPIAMAAGLLFMLLEMGQPLRIYKTWIRFNLTSTLSWGGLLQQGFAVFSGIFAFLLLTDRNKNLRWGFGIFAGFFALFVAFYHGFLLSFVTARPLWNAGAVNVASITSSVTTGIAAVLLLVSFTAAGRRELQEMRPVLRHTLLLLLLVQLSTCFIWLITLMTGKADFVHAYHVLNQQFGIAFWIGAVAVGLIVPFLILFAHSIGPRKEKALPVLLTAIPILIGGLIFRYILIIAGQMS